jgi:hypothetical protein
MRHLCVLAGVAALLATQAAAQERRQGPVARPAEREVRRITVQPDVEPPPIPVEEIVQRFTQKEDELKRAHDAYNYQISVRVQEFPADGSAGAEMQIVSETYRKADGQRYGRIIKETPGPLRYTDFYREDLQELAALPVFVLTSDQLPRYELTYAGRQPLDELTTYIFRVRPRRLERRERQFEGVVWVDDRDFVIVKTYGKWVAEVIPDAQEMPFQMFETYREIVGEKCWFPTYMRAEDVVKSQAGEARVRLTIRYTDYQPAPATPPAPPK